MRAGQTVPTQGGTEGHLSRESFQSHLQELELFHYYTAHTYKSLSVVGLTDETWQDFVPRQALKQVYLLHGLMGLAALHLAHTMPEKCEPYLLLTRRYQDTAFLTFQDELDRIGPDNCHAMMAFSVIATVYAIATPDVFPNGKVVDRVMVLLSFVQGIGTIADAGREWITNGPFGLFLDIESRIQLDPLNNADERLLERLRRINDTSLKLVDPSGHWTITSAIDLLEKTFQGGDLMVLAWLCMCGSSFIAMLRQEHRVALMVFIHWAIPLHRLKRLWWVGDMADLLVAEISPVLDSLGVEWHIAVEDVRARTRM